MRLPTWARRTRSSKVGIFDRAGRAAGKADNAERAGRSTDRFAADILNNFATANNTGIANTAGIEHPSMGQGKGYIVLEGRGYLKRANQKVPLPTNIFSSVRLLSTTWIPMRIIKLARRMPSSFRKSVYA